MKQTRVAAAAVGAAMLIGAGTGVAMAWPSGAGATSTSVSDTTADSTVTTDGSTVATDAPSDTTAEPGKAPGAHAGRLEDALAALVSAGTITQEQADAIVAAIEANRPTGAGSGNGPGDGHVGPGHGGFGGGHRGPGFGAFGGPGAGLDAAATALGITTDELLTELQAGKTIADVAGEKGVDVQTVIDAIVAAETAHLTEQVTNAVNGVRPEWPHMSDSDADDTTTTTTG